MRILAEDILPKIFVLLILILTVLLSAIYFMTRRKTNVLGLGIRVFSISLLTSLVSLFLDLSLIELHSVIPYRKLAHTGFTFSLIVFVLTCVYFLVLREKNLSRVILPPDLRSVFLSSDDLILIVESNGHIVENNHPEKFAAFTGYSNEDIHDITQGFAASSAGNAFLSNLSHLERKWECEIHAGQDIYMVSNTPVPPGKPFPIGSILTFHNINEEKAYEGEMKNQNEQLQKANQKLEQYLKIAAALEEEKEKANLLHRVQLELVSKIEEILIKIRGLYRNEIADTQEVRSKIANVTGDLRGAYKQVRQTIQSISSKKVNYD